MKKVLKKYNKPVLNSIQLDQEIALVMMSWLDPDNPPPPPPIPGGLGAPSETSSSTSSSFTEDPFGKE